MDNFAKVSSGGIANLHARMWVECGRLRAEIDNR